MEADLGTCGMLHYSGSKFTLSSQTSTNLVAMMLGLPRGSAATREATQFQGVIEVGSRAILGIQDSNIGNWGQQPLERVSWPSLAHQERLGVLVAYLMYASLLWVVTTRTPECTSLKGLIVSSRWCLGCLTG